MDSFALLSPVDRRDAIQERAAQMNVEFTMVEKDFWVCWTLKSLFLLSADHPAMTFKGGTSLSKAYGLIDRFSEDIDIVTDPLFFIEHDDADPEEAGISGTNRSKRMRQLDEATTAYMLVDALVRRIFLIEKVDDDDVVLLAVTVAAADALLDALRVPRQIVVDDHLIAREQAAARGIDVVFANADAFALEPLGRTFETILDCGLFHSFDADERRAYAASLATVTDDHATLYVLCSSDDGPDTGPHPITQDELRATFNQHNGWNVVAIVPARVETRYHDAGAAAWLATIGRVRDVF